MANIKTIPAKKDYDIGDPINVYNGIAYPEKVLKVNNFIESNYGGEASYVTEIVTDETTFYESTGLSIKAGGRYKIFTANGEVSLSENFHYQSFSKYTVVTGSVINAYKEFDEYEISKAAQRYLGDKKSFKIYLEHIA